jgi:type II secretory pathway pseudopilin PulG
MTRRGTSSGYSLLEALAALAIVGMGLLAASSGLHSQAALARRTELRRHMLAAAEEVVEGVRAETIPLTGGTVTTRSGQELEPGAGVRTFLQVVPLQIEGLYQVTAVARARLHGESLELQLVTMVWRP